MASPFLLQLPDHHFSAEQILQLDLPSISLTSAEKQILLFCKEWLNGQENFEVHTSGSTGNPKPIVLDRKQMAVSARQTVQALGLAEGTKALLCMNPAYIGGKMMLVRAMEFNMTLQFVEPEADPLSKLQAGDLLDFTALVPLQLEAILKNPHSKSILQSMQAVIVGGAPVSWQLRLQVQELAPVRVYSTYGMTETVSNIALQPLNSKEITPYFTAFPGIHLSQDERGCLLIQGAVTGGKKIVTNDVVELSDQSRFRWVGRADNIINSGGIKIQLEKIDHTAERLLQKTGHSRNFFSWGIPDERLGQKLVLLVEGNPLPPNAEESWKQLLKETLAKYEQPKAIYYIPQFSLTESGKIQKAQTLALLSQT